MSRGSPAEATHPKSTELALYATGDLPWRGRLRLRLHLKRCRSCSGDLDDLRHTIADLQSGRAREEIVAAPPPDWTALEREMLGNIGVGLAAARCIAKVRVHRGFVWRGSLLAVILAVLFVMGWVTHIPRAQDSHLLGSFQRLFNGNGSLRDAPMVRAEAQQLSLGVDGSGLTLLHPPAANTSSYGDSEIDVRYLDEETGQVTILRASAVPNHDAP